MTINLSDIDAHEQPSASLKNEFKKISQLKEADIPKDLRLLDSRDASPSAGFTSSEFTRCGTISKEQIQEAQSHLGATHLQDAISDVPIFHHQLLPGKL
jgi:hypothetical protein